jgi:DnaK suppressor protein
VVTKLQCLRRKRTCHEPLSAHEKYRLSLNTKIDQIKRDRIRREAIAVENAPDAMDQRQLLIDRELAVAVIDYESELAREIANALQRVDEGTYGRCEDCGASITTSRPDVVPWTRYCKTCQALMEQESEEQAKRRRGASIRWRHSTSND